MGRQIVWLKATCLVCGKEYQYVEAPDGVNPLTCGIFDCLYKFLHEPQYKHIRQGNPLYSGQEVSDEPRRTD